jgi:cell division protein FtsX
MTVIAYPAVIADARAIQRRRRLHLALLAVVVLVVAGGAFALFPRHHVAAKVVTIRVYVDPSQVQRATSVVRSQSGLVSTSYVSAGQALAEMRKKAPRLVNGLRSNPLPAKFVVRLRTSDAAAASSRLKDELGAAAQAVVITG